jgi:hypothetical protein
MKKDMMLNLLPTCSNRPANIVAQLKVENIETDPNLDIYRPHCLFAKTGYRHKSSGKGICSIILMFKHYFEQIQNIEIWPIISLILFFVFFTLTIIRIIFMDKKAY